MGKVEKAVRQTKWKKFYKKAGQSSSKNWSNPAHMSDNYRNDELSGDARFLLHSLCSHIFQFGYFCFNLLLTGIVHPQTLLT